MHAVTKVRLSGSDYPDGAVNLNILAAILPRRRQLEQTRALQERALAINKAVYAAQTPTSPH